VAVGLDELPPEVSKYVAPVIDIAQNLLASAYPASLGTILNSAAGGGLLGAVTSTINIAVGNNVVTPALLENVVTGLTSGAFGEIPKLFGSLSNLDAVSKLAPALGSLPVLATTALGMIGQAESMTKLLGAGGLGIDQLSNLVGGGFSAAATIVSGVKGLKGCLGGRHLVVVALVLPGAEKLVTGRIVTAIICLRSVVRISQYSDAYSPNNAPIPNNTGPSGFSTKTHTDAGRNGANPSNRRT
jgi:hypothetical protein